MASGRIREWRRDRVRAARHLRGMLRAAETYHARKAYEEELHIAARLPVRLREQIELLDREIERLEEEAAR